MAVPRIFPLMLFAFTSAATVVAQTSFTPTYPAAFTDQQYGNLQADLNGDGIPDILSGEYPAQALLSSGGGHFVLHKYGFDGVFIPIAAGDYNGDGHNDVLFYNFAGGSQLFEIGYGDGKGNFPSVKTFPNLPGFVSGERGVVEGLATDMNGDGRVDIVLGYQDPSNRDFSVRLYLNNGKGFTDKGVIYTYVVPAGAQGVQSDGTPPVQLTLGDFDADGHADIALRVIYAPASNQLQASNNLVVLYGDGAGAVTPRTVYSNRDNDLTFAASDINDDTFTDLAATDFDGSIHIFYGSSSRTFKEAVIPASSLQHPAYRGAIGYPPVVADFDGNGYKDVAYAAQSTADGTNTVGLSIVYQTPSRTWQSGGLTAVGTFQSYLGASAFSMVYVGDYNKDAKADVSLVTSGDANTHPNTAALLINAGTHAVGTCAAPAIGINVCSPGGSSASPVKFSFSATSFYPLRKMEVWVDGVKKSETFHVFGNQGYSDVSLALSAGKHKVSFFSGTFDGGVTKKSVIVTVP